MTSTIKKFHANGKFTVSDTYITDASYEVMMGSVAYRCNDTKSSDIDIHAITIPPLNITYPHTTGAIPGFGVAPPSFESFQQHGIIVNDKNYDIVIYSVIKAFQLASENNPNILDMLWVPEDCILHIDNIGTYIRQNRKHFLHRGAYHKFRGYSYSQLKKLESTPRKDLIEKFGYDTKHAYHIIRLAYQCQQILEEGDMDITRNAEMLKAIRRGEWTLERLKERFYEKEKELDQLYIDSKLRYEPDMKFLGEMLMACLEMKYGSLDELYKQTDNMAFRKLEEIRRIVNG